jgi:hypothetical protein
MKDKALKLALEAHQAMREWIDAVPDDTVLPTMPGCDRDWLDTVEANLKQALAAPVQPVKPSLWEQYHAAQPAPVQEPDLIARLKHPEDHYEFTDPKKANAVLMSLCQEAADALAAPVQPMAHIVGEIDHTGKVWKPVQPAPVQPVAWMQSDEVHISLWKDDYHTIPLYTTPPAQPAVPDAIHHTDLSESLEYIQGWNDCRALMLEGRKP